MKKVDIIHGIEVFLPRTGSNIVIGLIGCEFLQPFLSSKVPNCKLINWKNLAANTNVDNECLDYLFFDNMFSTNNAMDIALELNKYISDTGFLIVWNHVKTRKDDEKYIDILRGAGFRDVCINRLESSSLSVFRASKSTESSRRLKEKYTPGVRSRLSKLLRRIEYDIDRENNTCALQRLCNEYGMDNQYISLFAKCMTRYLDKPLTIEKERGYISVKDALQKNYNAESALQYQGIDSSKIAFISCVNNKDLYDECLLYLESLFIPNSMMVEFIPIYDAVSMADGYNKGMKRTNAKYKVYLHQDTLIVNKNFIRDILNIFSNPSIGLLGVIGCSMLPKIGVWWRAEHQIGQVLQAYEPESMLISPKEQPGGLFEYVEAVDGLLIATQYDVPWRQDLLNGWHMYDISQCKEFYRHGYMSVVPRQDFAWCIHCPTKKPLDPKYNGYRIIFLKEYWNELLINQTSEKLVNDIYSLFEQGKFAQSQSRALTLYQSTCNSDNYSDNNLMGQAVELLAVISIEQNDKYSGEYWLNLLTELPANAYRIFLQARIRFMLGDKMLAVELLEQGVKLGKAEKNNAVLEKIYNLLGQCYRFYGFGGQAAEYYRLAAESTSEVNLKLVEYSNYLFNLHYIRMSKQDYYAAHVGYGNILKDVQPIYYLKVNSQAGNITAVNNIEHKIRVGYLSPDFRNHVVLRFSWAMLTAYDRNKFKVFCYNNGGVDEYSKKLSTIVDGWRNVRGINPSKVAELINNDHVDILVDLSGHTKGNCLPILAHRPAPVQISGIGYFATTGLSSVDYFLSDSILASEPKYFVEKLLVLPDSHFCYVPLYNVPSPQGAPCKKNQYITFGSFNNLTKVNDDVLEIWITILKLVPKAHLLLKGSLFDDNNGRVLFLNRFVEHGIDVNSEAWQYRIELRGETREYLPEYYDVDIALDTFPYPGGGTTCDALYMGVPVITLSGDSHGESFGKSILVNAGLPECVAESVDDYICIAVALASDIDLLDSLHLNLRNMMEKSNLMNQKQYMFELERKYLEIMT